MEPRHRRSQALLSLVCSAAHLLLGRSAVGAAPAGQQTKLVRQWAPLVLSHCPPDGPRHLAPCLAREFNAKAAADGSPTRMLRAEELIFEDFALRLPSFPSDAHRGRWMPGADNVLLEGRVLVNGDWGLYQGQRGQNLVFANAAYRGTPVADSWAPGCCMHGDVRHDAFTVTVAEDAVLRNLSSNGAGEAAGEGAAEGAGADVSLRSRLRGSRGSQQGILTPRWWPSGGEQWDDPPLLYEVLGEQQYKVFQELVLVASPDSWSWQHFHDRVLNIMMQPRRLLTPGSAVAVAGRRPSVPIMHEIWRLLLHLPANTSSPDLESHFIRPGQQRLPVFANRLVHSCRAPLIHPWHFHAYRRALGLHFPPQPERRTVLYLSRGTPDAGVGDPLMFNGGRQVVNEGELLPAIEALLAQRGRGERLVVFKAAEYPTLAALQALMAGVTAIVGPHGGAFLCLYYAPPETLVLEFLHIRKLALYEIASVLDMRYWAFVQAPLNARNDLRVDVGEVVRVLGDELGQERPASVRPHTSWPGTTAT